VQVADKPRQSKTKVEKLKLEVNPDEDRESAVETSLLVSNLFV